MTTTTDRIQKQILLQAPLARVWQALTDAKQFGEWFGVQLEGKFAPGKSMVGKITTPGCEHMSFEIEVETIEPQSLFSYRWRPHATEPGKDYSADPTTLVEFRLEAVDSSTQLNISESGFDNLPPETRADAFRRNEGGWAHQAKSIEAYVTKR